MGAKRLTPDVIALRAITERSWQETVVHHARTAQWLVHFIPDTFHVKAVEDGSFRKIKQGDPGYPDLTLVRGNELMFVELKRETGKLSEAQEIWRDTLIAAGAEWHLWRPSDLDEFVIPRIYNKRE